MNTRTCRNLRGEPAFGLKFITILFAIIIPIVLGICALVEYHKTEVPKVTTASFLEKSSSRYLGVVTSKYESYKSAKQMAADASYLPNTDELSLEQLCDILGINSEETKILKDSTLETYVTPKSGDPIRITVSDNHIRIANRYRLTLEPNGGISNTWGGFNSEHDTSIVVGGKKRSLEELASIAAVAKSVEKVEGKYQRVNLNGNRHGLFWEIFCAYLFLDAIISLLCGAFVLTRRR